MTSAILIGSTGLVGSHILTTLTSHPGVASIHTISRRAPPNPTSSTKLQPLLSPATDTWPTLLKSISPTPQLLISGLGTTRAAAGGFAAQRLIDYDLNLSVAQAAKAAGVKVYVLISSAGTGPNASMGYPKMKWELEEAVRGLGFERCVILRPGLIMGDRQESRLLEGAARGLAKGIAAVGFKGFVDGWAQDSSVIAKAAVHAGLDAVQGKGEGKEGGVWMVEQADIIRLGKTEYKE